MANALVRTKSIGELIAPPRRNLRALSHAELVEDLSLSQEVYVRVRKMVNAGMPAKNVFPVVAEDLNTLGFRNVRDKPLTGSVVRRRFYDVIRSKRDASAL